MTAQQPQREYPIRPEVLAFAMRMEMGLRDHDKDRGDSYKNCDSEFLIRRLKEEVEELEKAITKFEDVPYPNKSHLLADAVVAVLSESGDVGNFAMMLSYMAYPSHKHLLEYLNACGLYLARPHTPVPDQGTSKLCFGTQHPASECCQQCNELETCKQKQRYLDYDRKEAPHTATLAAYERILADCCKECPIKEEIPVEDYCAESCEGCLVRKTVESLRTAAQEDK